jgi:diguanylate cyclase (GGDEF)-like protein
VVNDGKLSVVLSEFARTLITDFPIQGILDHLVLRIVELMPVTSAGVTLIAEGKAPRYVAASDASALRFERLQSQIGEGPCLAAYRSGLAVSVADLAHDDRFPAFAPAAVSAGLAAVFTFPLRHGAGCLGALDLYRDTLGELDVGDLSAAQTLADVAAAYLLNAQSRDEALSASEQFHHTALHDPLTGLPNRLLLQERLEHAAQRARRSHTNAAILFADLDRFKQVNDTYGHQAGDELLREVARRLSGLVRAGDTLARFSGDEFVFLCEEVHAAADVEILARRIDEAFALPFRLSGTAVTVSASVGIAFAGRGEDISNELVVRADMAMYEVKHRGGAGHQIYDMRETLGPPQNDLESDLRSALAENRLAVAYQPIVRCADDRIIGVEALLRWTHTTRGVVAPLAMIEVAESSDLINEIGIWVLERSCRDYGRWRLEHPDVTLDLAVNVSTRQLVDPGFAASVLRVLERTGMDPATLILEMTESIFIEDSDRSTTVLGDLHALGIRLALDDFGTGYSSLSYLRRLPIDIIKIDRSFTADIGVAPSGSAIVSAITNLAHVLGLLVVAEGVETQTQHDEVGLIGCDHAQGYFYAVPLAASGIDGLLRARTVGPPRHHLLNQ